MKKTIATRIKSPFSLAIEIKKSKKPRIIIKIPAQ